MSGQELAGTRLQRGTRKYSPTDHIRAQQAAILHDKGKKKAHKETLAVTGRSRLNTVVCFFGFFFFFFCFVGWFFLFLLFGLFCFFFMGFFWVCFFCFGGFVIVF